MGGNDTNNIEKLQVTNDFIQVTSDLSLSDVENLIQTTIVGVTGLAGELVRPAIQAQPPTQPEANVNWCSFRVQQGQVQNFATPIMIGETEYVIEHEEMSVLVTFYGTDSYDLAGSFRAAMLIEWNRKLLHDNAIALVVIGERRLIPLYVNAEWLKRTDIEMILRRQIKRTASVAFLKDGEVKIKTDLEVKNG